MRRPLALLAVVGLTLIPGESPWAGRGAAAGIVPSNGVFEHRGEVRPDRGEAEPPLGIDVRLDIGTGEFVLDAERPFDPGSVRQLSSWEETMLLGRGGRRPVNTGAVTGERTGVKVDEAEGRAAGRFLLLLLAKGPARLEEGCRTGARVEATHRVRFAVGGVPYTVEVRAFDLRGKLPRVEVGDGR